MKAAKKPKSLKEFAQAAENLPADVGLCWNIIRDLRGQLTKAKATHGALMAAAENVLEPLRIPPTVRPFNPKRKYSKTAEGQVLHLSDLQIGKVTETYSIERFAVEMDDLFETTVELADIFRSHHPVDELLIAANGDLVEGEQIFPGQQWVSQVGVLKQAVMGAQIIAEDIARISHHWPKIRIKVTRGNHGRSGKDWCEESNWDLALGKFLELELRAVKNVTVEVCESWYTITDVKGKRIMQTHGDRVRTGGDTPFTAIAKRSSNWRASIPMARLADEALESLIGSLAAAVQENRHSDAAALLDKATKRPFDVLLIGHFHNQAMFNWHGSWVMMNGSPETANDYALSYMGQASNPMQTVFFVHPARGVTYQTPVYLGRGLRTGA